MTLSIKQRIVIWYTLWIIILISVVLVLLVSGSSFLVERRSRELLFEKVHDAADEIDFEHGGIDIDDDVKPFDEGVYIAIYASGGGTLFGHLPSSFPSLPLCL